MGTRNRHASSHHLGYYIYIFAKTRRQEATAQENGDLKFPDLREEDKT